MKIESATLIQQLRSDVGQQHNRVQELKKMTEPVLNWRETTDSWSVLECIEHLKRYNDFYIPEIDKQIKSSKHVANSMFKSGWIGNYFANAMLPKAKLNKMQTFKEMNPLHSHLNQDILNKFEHQLKELDNLLEASLQTNLSKVKTAISISTALKLRLGDTFRIVVNHQTRHFVQLNHVLNAMPK